MSKWFRNAEVYNNVDDQYYVKPFKKTTKKDFYILLGSLKYLEKYPDRIKGKSNSF